MSNAITRTYSFANGGVADGGQVDSEIQNIVNTINNADAGTTSWTQVKTGVFTSTGVTILKGSVTNDSAAAGNVGEIMTSTVSGIAFAATTLYKDATSLALTAGDWDLSLILYINSNGATWTEVEGGIGTVTGNDSTGLSLGDNGGLGQWASSSTTPLIVTIVVPSYRVSLAASVTYYAKIEATFSAGGPPNLTRGRFSARRVR